MADRYMIFDTEGTGIDRNKDVFFQLSYLIFTPGSGIEKVRNHLVVPKREISPGAQQVNGMSKMKLRYLTKDTKLEDINYNEIKEDFESCILVGHNVQYDVSIVINTFLESLDIKLSPGMYFDTLSLARNKFPQFSDHKLGTIDHYLNEIGIDTEELCKKLFGSVEDLHDARRDVASTFAFFIKYAFSK